MRDNACVSLLVRFLYSDRGNDKLPPPLLETATLLRVMGLRVVVISGYQ